MGVASTAGKGNARPWQPGSLGETWRAQDKDEKEGEGEEEEAATVGEKLQCGNMRVGGAKL